MFFYLPYIARVETIFCCLHACYINYVQYLSSANVQDEQSYYLVLFGR